MTCLLMPAHAGAATGRTAAEKSGGAGREIHGVKKNALYKYALEQQGGDYRRYCRNSAATPVPGELTRHISSIMHVK